MNDTPEIVKQAEATMDKEEILAAASFAAKNPLIALTLAEAMLPRVEHRRGEYKVPSTYSKKDKARRRKAHKTQKESRRRNRR